MKSSDVLFLLYVSFNPLLLHNHPKTYRFKIAIIYYVSQFCELRWGWSLQDASLTCLGPSCWLLPGAASFSSWWPLSCLVSQLVALELKLCMVHSFQRGISRICYVHYDLLGKGSLMSSLSAILGDIWANYTCKQCCKREPENPRKRPGQALTNPVIPGQNLAYSLRKK